MMQWMKSMDLNQMKNQIFDLKDQVQEIRLRKPWTRRGGSRRLIYVALGAGLALAASALFRNRKEVAQFCGQCGDKIKDGLESSGIKNKAKRAMGTAKDGAREVLAPTVNGQEPFQ